MTHTKTNRTEYPQQPGTGGDHSAVWTSCGINTEAVQAPQVHQRLRPITQGPRARSSLHRGTNG